MKRRKPLEIAVDYLARREHSAVELTQKLERKAIDAAAIEQVLNTLQHQSLQSDDRFAEQFIRMRVQRGYGPLRIEYDLKQRGVAPNLIHSAMQQADVDWFALAHTVRCKRFGEVAVEDAKTRAKQQRFLQSRGFTFDHITESLNCQSYENQR